MKYSLKYKVKNNKTETRKTQNDKLTNSISTLSQFNFFKISIAEELERINTIY
jgi:hypothetical protein